MNQQDYPPNRQPDMTPMGNQLPFPPPTGPYGTNQTYPYQPEPAQPKRRSRHRGGLWIAGLCVLLIVVVAAGSILRPDLVERVQQKLLATTGQTRQLTSSTHTQPTPKPTPTLDDEYQTLAQQYVAKMNLTQELGQMLIVQYTGNDYSDDLNYMIANQYVGGVIMYSNSYENQLQTATQAKTDIATMQKNATTPLFIGIDEEGSVSRLYNIYGSRESAAAIAASGSTTVAAQQGKQVALDMTALGLNVNFAPDVDVSNTDDYIGYDLRSFGDTASDVIKYSEPYLEAMQSNGVIGCIKHFPGLGSVPKGEQNDPHFVLPTVTKTKAELESSDLVPFQHYITATNPSDQPGFIMPTDVLVPAYDSTYPAEFSRTIITGLLRNDMGYNGVILSDSVIMGGVQINGVALDQAQASVLAIEAGDDMALDITGSVNVAAVIQALQTAITQGKLSKAQIDASVIRIIKLKMERKLIQTSLPPMIPAANS